jgi:D-alanine--poly(phosphoribitol) ligase subunit 2
MVDTTANRELVLKSLYAALDELNEERAADEQLARSEEQPLYGENAPIDSIDLVRLVVLIEQEIADNCGQSVTITDARAMSGQSSSFQSVGTLVEYVVKLLEE